MKTILGAIVDSGHVLQWDKFMSGQVGHEICSENLFFLELLISELWTMGCGFVFSTHSSGNCGWDSFSDICFSHMARQQWRKNWNLDLVQETISIWLPWSLFGNVLQDAEGRINSFLQCHALWSWDAKPVQPSVWVFQGIRQYEHKISIVQGLAHLCRFCWWPDLCVPHHALCLSCWYASPGRTQRYMGMNRLFQLRHRL